MQLQSFSSVSMHIHTYIHTHAAVDRRVIMTDTHTHSCPPLILRVLKHAHIWAAPLTALLGVRPLHTHTQLAMYWRFGWWWHTYTHPYPCPYLIICTNTRSVSPARMRRYVQIAYLFHQFATSFLSRDCRIADCRRGVLFF